MLFAIWREFQKKYNFLIDPIVQDKYLKINFYISEMDPNFNGFDRDEFEDVEPDLNHIFYNEFLPVLTGFSKHCLEQGIRMFLYGVAMMVTFFGVFVGVVTLPFSFTFFLIVILPIWTGFAIVVGICDVCLTIFKPFFILFCFRYFHQICRFYRFMYRVEDFLTLWLSETPRRILFGAPTTVTFNEFNEDLQNWSTRNKNYIFTVNQYSTRFCIW